MSGQPAITDAPVTGSCPHCGTAVEGGDAYCCPGCELAAQIIGAAGAGERYYGERVALPPRPGARPAGWAGVAAREVGHALEADLAVDGLRCASCVWVTERVLEQTPGVVSAHVSYASGRATVRWDPERVDLDTVAGRIAALGYQPRPVHEGGPDRDLLVRLGLAVFLAANVMGLQAALYAGLFQGIEGRYEALFRWIVLALATPSALYCAGPFFRGAVAGLRQRVLSMDLPIALAVGALFVHGAVAVPMGVEAYLDSLVMLVAALLAGRFLEARGRRRAVEAAAVLADALPQVARRADGRQVPVAELAPGDRIEVGAGERVAADGRVHTGVAQVRMAMLTGESMPVEVGVGEPVPGGAEVVDGSLVVEVTAPASASLGERLGEQLRASVHRGLRATPADRLAPWLVGVTLVVAGGAAAAWTALSGAQVGLAVGVSVLVVACPCALGLSYPLAAAAGLAAAARRGAVLRRGETLLALAAIEVVGLDKTGTVTGGDLRVVTATDVALRIAAALERTSSHPVGRAIVAEALDRGIALARAVDVSETVGVGVAGWLDGRRWALGAGGAGSVALESDDGERHIIELRDVVRPSARRAVASLASLGLDVELVTGDHPAVAAAIAEQSGIAVHHARVDPEAKADWVRRQGRPTLFVGDGLNDGAAMAAADVGLAMAGGADAAVLVADGLVAGGRLEAVAGAVRVARVVRRVVRGNLVRSVAYNVLAVTAASAGLVDPLVAAVLMPLSSALVVATSARVEARVAAVEAQ